jgi:hypothetical protein
MSLSDKMPVIPFYALSRPYQWRAQHLARIHPAGAALSAM